MGCCIFRSVRAHGRLPLRRNACSRTGTLCKRRFHRNRAARQLFSRSNPSAARGRAVSSCNPMETRYDYPDLSRRNIACKPNSKRVHDSLLSTWKYHVPSRESPCRSLQLRGSSSKRYRPCSPLLCRSAPFRRLYMCRRGKNRGYAGLSDRIQYRKYGTVPFHGSLREMKLNARICSRTPCRYRHPTYGIHTGISACRSSSICCGDLRCHAILPHSIRPLHRRGVYSGQDCRIHCRKPRRWLSLYRLPCRPCAGAFRPV